MFAKTIKIGARLVGEGQPVFFIADIGANFDNDINKAKELALAAKEAGVDCVKIQSFLSEKIVSGPSFAKMQLKGVHGTWGKPIDQVFKEAEFPRAWHKELMEYCKSIGIIFSSAPYDFEAVDLLDSLGVDFFKIGSGDIAWLEILEYIAKKGKPVILATGDSTLAEVDEAVRTIEKTGNNQLVLLQCITNYPSKIESANINVLKNYQTAFNVITGYSDHSPGDIVVLGSVALGGKVIEKHLTLSKQGDGPDHPHSMEPEEFKQLIQKTRLLEKALGDTKKEVVGEEQETVIVQRRSLHVKRDIKKGEIISLEDIIELRPAVGILPKHKNIVAGRKAKSDMLKYEAIYWENLE
ncbi:MAG: flagellar biosynthesis protein FlgA [Candidatus Staskawiczbacteria bacterium RIFCSPHIGHO2_02_FULL_34_10]|uniref:Flagellar biosynthesis protein FlgA n=2 Tax=Candidatus Staskawicziibacteriota TaxID=1817916 RepID=A0A1G2HL24_9BACT|nr:MAG: flagellar biosynthesis protein FlgA [Candidatus Staskawiczbacteria bacterium RIFCSPHIGHO2_01_FULL_34_27]OGZ66725.1 MAG: flagellar biosynthesis protein FlgA [Candidatus Staskawiczbacteria bacterium RIFCSPHIGHO2_02_FULL_34_10]